MSALMILTRGRIIASSSTAARIDLDDRHTDACAGEHFGKMQRDLAAADECDVTKNGEVSDAEIFDQRRKRFRLRGDMNLVALFDDEIARWNEQLLATLYGADQNFQFGIVRQFVQLFADERIAASHGETDHFHTAVSECFAADERKETEERYRSRARRKARD